MGLLCKRLITPVKIRFANIIHSFLSFIKNKGDNNYLFVSMDNIPDNHRE